MKQHTKLPIRDFFRVWTLYGSMFAGAVGSLVLIVVMLFFSSLELLRRLIPQLNQVFREEGIFSSFENMMSNGLEYLATTFVLLLILWFFLALISLLPATIIGLVYELLTRYVRAQKTTLLLTYGLAALFSVAYGVVAMGLQFDGIPFLNVPLALVTGLVACNITLRFRHDVVELKQGSSVATA